MIQVGDRVPNPTTCDYCEGAGREFVVNEQVSRERAKWGGRAVMQPRGSLCRVCGGTGERGPDFDKPQWTKGSVEAVLRSPEVARAFAGRKPDAQAEMLCPCMVRARAAERSGQPPPDDGYCGCMGPRGQARVMEIRDLPRLLNAIMDATAHATAHANPDTPHDPAQAAGS